MKPSQRKKGGRDGRRVLMACLWIAEMTVVVVAVVLALLLELTEFVLYKGERSPL